MEGRPEWNRLIQHDCCTASELSWEGTGKERRRAEEGEEGGGRRLGIRKFLIAFLCLGIETACDRQWWGGGEAGMLYS